MHTGPETPERKVTHMIGIATLTAITVEEEYERTTGRRPTLLRAHPVTLAMLENDLWTFAESQGNYGMPKRVLLFRGMRVLEDPMLAEGEFRVGTVEEAEAEVLDRLDEWRVRSGVKRRD